MQKSLDFLYNTFLDKIDHLLNVERKTLDEVGKICGVGKSTVIKWRDKDIKSIDVHNLGKYCDALRITLDEHTNKNKPTPAISRTGAHSPVEIVDGDNLPRIPVVGEAGAGTPAEFFNCVPESWLPVLPLYFFPGVRAFKVIGDSMEPTIMKGSYVGVIPFSGRLTEGGIYLVEDPDFGLVVKRVRKDRSGAIMLFSDNPSWEPIPMPFEGYEHIIAGEVCWVWQVLR